MKTLRGYSHRFLLCPSASTHSHPPLLHLLLVILLLLLLLILFLLLFQLSLFLFSTVNNLCILSIPGLKGFSTLVTPSLVFNSVRFKLKLSSGEDDSTMDTEAALRNSCCLLSLLFNRDEGVMEDTFLHNGHHTQSVRLPPNDQSVHLYIYPSSSPHPTPPRPPPPPPSR